MTFPSAGFTIAGTVLLPPVGRHVQAAAVLITGSGPLDRNGSDRRAPIDVSRQLAEHLAGNGVATLRYDKRGVAASGGDFLAAGLDDNIDDARAALESLAAQPECAPYSNRRVPMVAIGHSEGALIAAALAAEADSIVGGAVLLAGPAKPGAQLLAWQAAKIAPTLPKPVRLILRVLRTDPVKQQRKFLDRIAASTGDTVRMQGRRINAKWFRELLEFDPVGAPAGHHRAGAGHHRGQGSPGRSGRSGDHRVHRRRSGHHPAGDGPDAHPAPGSGRAHSSATIAGSSTLPVDSAVLQDISGWIDDLVRRSDAANRAVGH